MCEGAGSYFALEHSLVDQHFQMWPQLVSGHVISIYGGVFKSSRSPCISSTRSMK